MKSTSELRLGFIGAGKVAQTLASGFCKAGLRVTGASSRQSAGLLALLQRAPTVSAMSSAQEVVDKSDLVFLTVSDDAIEGICKQLIWRPGVSVVHCSGATEVSALAKAASQGAATGGFHPMQMFTDPDVALSGLRGCTIGVEAEGNLLATLEELTRALGCRPFHLQPGTRAAYHASAYYVGPFLIALLQEGVNLWKRMGASEREALSAMVPLLKGTLSAVMESSLAGGMGGCIARGDLGTVKRHLEALDAIDLNAGALYRELAKRNIPLGMERGTLSHERAKIIQDTLMA